MSNTFVWCSGWAIAAPVPSRSISTIKSTLVLQSAEQNLPIPSIEQTYTNDRAPADTGPNVDPTPYTDDPYDNGPIANVPGIDDLPFDLVSFLHDPGKYFSKYIRQFLGNVIRPLARKLSSVLLIFVLNPNIAADGLRNARTDVQKIFNQTADVMFYIAIDLSLILFVVAIWRHWSDSAWRGRSGSWMSSIGRLIFTIGLLLLWKTIYTLELDLTNEMIKAVWFNDPAQRDLLVSTIERAFLSAAAGVGGISLASFAPLMGALGGSIVGGPAGMVIGGAAGGIVGLVGWLLFIVLGVIVITEIVYFLVLKAIQEALLAAQFLVGYCFLVCFASPDTEHMATGFVRSFIEVSLWSFVWLILLKVLTIVLNSSTSTDYVGAQTLLIIGVLQIMIQVPTFMGRAQISPISEFLTAGAVTGLVSKGLSGTTDSIKKAVTDISDYQLNAKYASVGTPETTATALRFPGQARDENRLQHHLDASHRKAGSEASTASSTGTSTVGSGSSAPLNSASTGSTPAESAQSTSSAAQSTANQPQASGIPTPPVKGTGRNLESLPAAGAADPNASPDEQSSSGSADTSAPGAGSTLPATAAASIPPTATSTVSAAVTTPATASTAAAPAAKKPHPEAVKGLNRTLASNYTNARIRPWVQDLNDGTNMANFGEGDESVIHMGERGSRMVQYAENSSRAQMGFTVATAGMASDLANNPRGRDAARRSVLARHLDQPRSLGEHVAAAAVYTAKGQFFNQTKLGQNRGQLGMLDELAAGSANYLTLGDAGHHNAVTEQLEGTFGNYDSQRQAATLSQMIDEDSTEGGLNRSNASATRINIGHGFQINDLMRAIDASHVVAGTRIGQRDKAIGLYNYLEAKAGKSGSRMGNDEAQPLVNAVTPEEANACMIIAKNEGPEACRNVDLVHAVATMGHGSNPQSYEAALTALDAQIQAGSGGAEGRIGDASPAAIAAAAQTIQQLRRAGFSDNQLSNRETFTIVDNLVAQAGGNPPSPLVQTVMASDPSLSQDSISPAHIAEQVLKNIGAQPTAQNRQIVIQMMSDGYDAKDINSQDFSIAGALIEQGGGQATPDMVHLAQAQGYAPGRRLSNHTLAHAIAARVSGSGTSVDAEQVEATHVLLDNHVDPKLIDGDMVSAAVIMQQNGVSPKAMNAPNMVAAAQLVRNNAAPGVLTVDNLNATKYIAYENFDPESVQAARCMVDAKYTDAEHHSISNQQLYVGKGLVAEGINPTREIVTAVMKSPEYQLNPYQYGVTPPGGRADIPQAVVDQYKASDPLPANFNGLGS